MVMYMVVQYIYTCNSVVKQSKVAYTDFSSAVVEFLAFVLLAYVSPLVLGKWLWLQLCALKTG